MQESTERKKEKGSKEKEAKEKESTTKKNSAIRTSDGKLKELNEHSACSQSCSDHEVPECKEVCCKPFDQQ